MCRRQISITVYLCVVRRRSAAAVVAVVDGDGVVVLVVAVVVVCCMKVVAVVLVVVVAEYSVVVLVVVAVVLAVVVAYAVGGNMPSSNCFWSGGNWGRCYDPIAFNWMGMHLVDLNVVRQNLQVVPLAEFSRWCLYAETPQLSRTSSLRLQVSQFLH